MNYEQEWDYTCNEMQDAEIEIGDKVLCSALEVYAGEVVEIRKRGEQHYETFYLVKLYDGSFDEFAAEDTLKRKVEVVA